ncbi:Rrf1p [Sugiyamaella lignohabitans]|uniref:Ribosome-recycling factor, mitochondrial n=1 Tax=Sugiyamaella lignohabitans TaxID=796027 RepID=A0A161HJE6_9ASCO|nr:Rrf1p [Sugiyamaella lignohabitans]ANB11538.1 Rrf1p [Sugiyamaella lignohabitans]
MIRSFVVQQTRAISAVNAFSAARSFSSSQTVLKKAQKKAHKSAEPVDEAAGESVAPLDLDSLDAKYKKTLQVFNEKLKEIRTSKIDVSKFTSIPVTLQHGESHLLNEIATLQLRGNRLSIVVFDPKHVKYVSTSILSHLNITPQVDPKNNQTLLVSSDTDSGDDSSHESQILKEIKQLHDHFRNSPSKHSLSQIRAGGLSHLKRALKSKDIDKDSFRKQSERVEKAFKDYSDKLASAFKAAQNSSR